MNLLIGLCYPSLYCYANVLYISILFRMSSHNRSWAHNQSIWHWLEASSTGHICNEVIFSNHWETRCVHLIQLLSLWKQRQPRSVTVYHIYPTLHSESHGISAWMVPGRAVGPLSFWYFDIHRCTFSYPSWTVSHVMTSSLMPFIHKGKSKNTDNVY